MFKRVRWAGAGAVVGVGASVWAQRRVKAAAARYLPREVAGEAARRAERWRRDLRDALDDGRATMHLREAELRRRWEPPGAGSPPPPGALPPGAGALPPVVARSRPAGRRPRHPE